MESRSGPGREKEDKSQEWEASEEGIVDIQEGGDDGSDWGLTVEVVRMSVSETSFRDRGKFRQHLLLEQKCKES